MEATTSSSEPGGLNSQSAEPEANGNLKRATGLDEDLDKIEELDMEEIPLEGSVYNVCSVEIAEAGGGGDTTGKAGNVEEEEEGEEGKGEIGDPGQNSILKKKVKDIADGWKFRKIRTKTRAGARDSSSAWSFTKFVRDRLLICCRSPSPQEGIEVGDGIFEDADFQDDAEAEASETESSLDPASLTTQTVWGRQSQLQRQRPTNLESIFIIDCNENATNTQANFKRFWFSSGSLLIQNSPFIAAMALLNKPQPSLLESVKHIHFDNCDLSIENLCLMLGQLQLVEEFRIGASIGVNNKDNQLFRAHLMKEFQASREDKDYFNNLHDRFGSSSSEDRLQRLKALSILMPMTWQCDLIFKAVEAVMNQTQLEILIIQSSMYDMLEFLICPENNIDIENESTWEELVKLDCGKALKRNRNSLKELSLSCRNRLPLEHLKIATRTETSIEAIFQWSFYCTVGILDVLQEVTATDSVTYDSNNNVFPIMSTLNIDLPFIPVRSVREELEDPGFQSPLKTLMTFVARNNHIPKVKVGQLRPKKGLENWLKHAVVSVAKNNMKIGCTYCSTTLANNLESYDDELVSLAFSIVPDEKRRRVSQIIEPNRWDDDMARTTWRYTGVRCLHIINQLPDLMSFDMDRITTKFNRLTKLAIEDYTVQYDDSNRVVGRSGGGDGGEEINRGRSLADSDMQAIFRSLVSLKQLHLDCNMTAVTDLGLTGIGESFWTRLSQRNKLFSFWYLNYLTYVFLRGLGPKVTDKSAVYAFSEDYSLSNLMELHLFAPGITNFGKEKIRKAYAERDGFVLEM